MEKKSLFKNCTFYFLNNRMLKKLTKNVSNEISTNNNTDMSDNRRQNSYQVIKLK